VSKTEQLKTNLDVLDGTLSAEHLQRLDAVSAAEGAGSDAGRRFTIAVLVERGSAERVMATE
jgi:diketogulonate reductase-like aldo/keto reductase